VSLLDRRNRSFGSSGVVVGDHELVEELPACRDPSKCVADPAGPNQDDAHL
jgi:hypothetical protein